MDNENSKRDGLELEHGIITKAAQVSTLAVTDKELNKINKLALEPLKAEDVFIFKVAMCDNEIDRTSEVFPLASLKKMQKLFIGKTMIKDHLRRADNQVARIYDTELQASETEVTKTNEVYTQLVAHCYMLATEANKDLIADIKGGIKKEVSVGLLISKALCSICGTDNAKQWCTHYPGQEYDKQTCYFKLEDPNDAYEVSFVAVPAQPRAGTTKNYGGKPTKEAEPAPTPEQPADTDTMDLRFKDLEIFLFVNKTTEVEGEKE